MSTFPSGLLPTGNESQSYGQIGDYIGGVWGTLFTALTLIVVYFTWRTTRRAETRNSIIAVLTEMLKTHDAIVGGAPALSAQALREFSQIYRATRNIEPNDEVWPIRTRVDIAYTMTFYGLSTESRQALAHYGKKNVKAVHDAISRLRYRAGNKFERWFKGHQSTLSHYMRNLYAMFVIIENSNLKYVEKIRFGKIIRTKLSNYDQALLAMNIVSHLGAEWEHSGIVDKYKPISNIPGYFFGYDHNLSLKSFFPMMQFEWEKVTTPRPTYRRFAIGALKMVWYRQWDYETPN